MDEVFKALADPTRREILDRLGAGPASVATLRAPLPMSAPAVSQHLAVLERAGLIERAAPARHRLVTAPPERLDEAARPEKLPGGKGRAPDRGSRQRRPGLPPDGPLREPAFTGADIDAARAERIGLVNDVPPDRDAVLAAAHDLAERIAANPPLTVQGTKDVLAVNRHQQVAAGLRYVAAWNAAFLPSDDLMEAVAAFNERRDPKFTGN